MPKKTTETPTDKPRRASAKSTAKMTERFAPKGRAVPNAEPTTATVAVPDAEAQTPAPEGQLSPASRAAAPPAELPLTGEARPNKDDIPRGLENTTALTVRLDPERYRLVRYHTFDYEMTNQEFLVRAIDAYLTAHDVLKAHGRKGERLSKEVLTAALAAHLTSAKS
jgi:hypothetical protein